MCSYISDPTVCELMKKIEQLIRMKQNDSNWRSNLTSVLNLTDSEKQEDPDSPGGCFYLLGLLDVFHVYYIPLIIFVGLLGNLLSCMVFLCTHLRLRSSSYYLAALSSADFGFLICLMFVWINDSTGLQIFNKNGWCQGLVYFSSVYSFLSVWLIVAFTFERYIAVQYPLQRPQMCTVKRAKIIIALLVVVGLAFHSYSFVTAGMIRVDGDEICDMKEEYADTMRIINAVDSIATLLLPFCLISFMNSMIMWNLMKFNSAFKTGEAAEEGIEMSTNWTPQGTSSRQGGTTPSSGSANQEPGPSKRTIPLIIRATSIASYRNPITVRSQHNITKMLLLISSVFVILNLPSYAIRLYIFFFYSLWREVTPVHLWCLQQFFMLLYYTNFSINFLLYSMYGVTFRRCLWGLLQKKFRFITSRFPCKAE